MTDIQNSRQTDRTTDRIEEADRERGRERKRERKRKREREEERKRKRGREKEREREGGVWWGAALKSYNQRNVAKYKCTNMYVADRLVTCYAHFFHDSFMQINGLGGAK